MARVRMEVCPNKARNRTQPWKVTKAGQLLFEHRTQRAAIDAARLAADCVVLEGNTVTLKIKRPTGEVRDERTYPRGSDPRNSKG